MPESEFQGYPSYEGTITFDSAYDFEVKEKKIQFLTSIISQCLRHTKNSYYVLKVVREYHRVCQGSEERDPESPHYHFILYSKFKLSVCRVRAIYNSLREYYGRCQFHMLTTLRKQHWEQYIMKDVEHNNQWLGFDHVNLCVIGPMLTCKPRSTQRYCEVLDEMSDIEDL